MDGFIRLIEQKYFVVDRYDVAAGSEVVVPTAGRPGCLVGLSGVVAVIGGDEGEVEMFPGRAVVLPAGCNGVIMETGVEVSFVRCWAP